MEENDDLKETNVQSDKEETEFYFESDHLALRGNPDYSAILRTIAILEAQRIQSTKEIEQIVTAEKIALEDPETFLEKLQKGEGLNLPGQTNIVEIPKINFEKYNVVIPDFTKSTSDNEDNTAHVNDITVRGRVFDQTKSETFNQLWTSDEQRRLEELLIEFPPEPIEMRRFAKIARALGNRTTKQVASRVQKFFKKLYSAGMPIPGRLPKNHRDYKSYRSMKHHYRTTTFFPAQDVPVIMPEDDEIGSVPFFKLYQKDNSTNAITVDQESEEDIPFEDDDSQQTRIVKLIQRVKSDKERFINFTNCQSEHNGYTCDICRESPLLGTRWHCTTCIHSSIDFCSDCFVTQLIDTKKKHHPIQHSYIGVRISNQVDSKPISDQDSESDETSTNFIKVKEEKFNTEIDETESPADSNLIFDKDYLPGKFSKNKIYNYLDPNYLPD